MIKNKPDFSAIIFDLDGTLINTLEEIATAGNNALERLGYARHGIDEYRRFVGNGAIKLAWRILPENKQTNENFELIYPLLAEEFGRLLNSIAKPYAGMVEALKVLAEKGIKCAVLSNKPDELTKKVIGQLLPDSEFFVVRGAIDGVPLKPEPYSCLEIAKAAGISPEHVIYLGDSDVDVFTARNAGMIPVGAGWGFRGFDELEKAGAEIVLESPLDLLNLI